MSSSSAIKDHYEVLNVPIDADAVTIKKAHRKLALKWHPDKNPGNQVAADTFRHIQQAYECLSDAAERKWYDEHREAILRGWSPNGDNNNEQSAGFTVEVTPFMHPGCYSGYGDDDNGFFAVYRELFQKLYDSEQDGWVSEGNIEDMPHADLPGDFGNSTSSWDLVGNFYRHWESFSSCRSFAWADKYDSKEAEDRRMRRAMEEENRKARKVARREFHEMVEALIHFVKRRDPRVDAQKQKAELEKEARKEIEKKDALRKKQMAQEARDEWKRQAEERIAQAEEEDFRAGRVRLADLDDEYDYGGKRGRRGRKKKKQQEYEEHDTYYFRESDSEGDGDDDKKDGGDESSEKAKDNEIVEETGDPKEEALEAAECQVGYGEADFQEIDPAGEAPQSRPVSDEDLEVEEDELDYDSDSESSDEEPEDWSCEACRKDFKSEGQLENHLKSKKHKEQFKKWQAKQKKVEKKEKKAALNDLLEELALDP